MEIFTGELALAGGEGVEGARVGFLAEGRDRYVELVRRHLHFIFRVFGDAEQFVCPDRGQVIGWTCLATELIQGVDDLRSGLSPGVLIGHAIRYRGRLISVLSAAVEQENTGK